MQSPYFPIIYIRGYAMTERERDASAADPFCGFNSGSTMYRASIDKNEPPKKFIFESPLLRLVSDFNYSDVYENGSDISEEDWQPLSGKVGIPARSTIIYRYYDSGSTVFGDGNPEPIEEYARGLDRLIRRVQSLVCKQEQIVETDFRCYLVAHSMGGLVARAFLQNPKLRTGDTHRLVDKFFTYGTPHNGIDVAGLNVPAFLSAAQMNTFNRARMADYLDMQPLLQKYDGRVDFMPESILPADKIFCMIGTNRNDYEVAYGLSRALVGRGSDGLVRVENASVWGLGANNEITRTSSVAYALRKLWTRQ
jgi:pimeloyl-ACP methyl ester carboxylesterase